MMKTKRLKAHWLIILTFALCLLPPISALSVDIPIPDNSSLFDTNASTECTGDEVLLGNTSCLSIVAFGGGVSDNRTWNQSYATTLFGFSNATWNQSFATTLFGFSNATWNQTFASSLYAINSSALYTTINSTYLMCYNNASYLSTINSTYLLAYNNASYLSTINATYLKAYNNASYLFDTNASTECSNGYYLDGDGNCHHFNDSVQRLFAEEQVVYNASTIITENGTYDSGDINSIGANLGEGDVYNVSEDLGAEPLRIAINFSDVVTFNVWAMRGKYDGGAGHSLEIQIYRIGVGWETREEITDQTTYGETDGNIFIASNFIDATGNVSFRIEHDDNGIPTHDYSLDSFLIGQVTGLVSGGDLGDLTGRDEACALLPDVFCNDGSKNITGNVTMEMNLTIWEDLVVIGNYCNFTSCFTLADFLLDTNGGNSTWNASVVQDNYNANYSFGANNFNGSGNFTTTGWIKAGNINVTEDLYVSNNSIYLGDIKLSATSDTFLVEGSDNINTTGNAYFGDGVLIVDNDNSRVGINTAPAPYSLHVSGNTYITGTIDVDGTATLTGGINMGSASLVNVNDISTATVTSDSGTASLNMDGVPDIIFTSNAGECIRPATDKNLDLGDPTHYWNNTYTQYLNATNVTANYFIGDGTYLTGVTGGNATWNQSVVIANYNANYSFGSNNFNGSGNFTTIGQGQFIDRLLSASDELLDDPEFTGGIGSTWENLAGTWAISGGHISKTGAPATAGETNPFVVKTNSNYVGVFNFASCVSAVVTANLGGDAETVLALDSGATDEEFVVYFNTIDTNSFNFTAGGSGDICNISSVSVKQVNTEENIFGETTIYNLEVQNKTTTDDLVVLGDATLSALAIDGGSTLVGTGTPIVNITGQSATLGGVGQPIVLTAGASPGASQGANIYLTTQTGIAYGDVVMVQDGGNVFIGDPADKSNKTTLTTYGNSTAYNFIDLTEGDLRASSDALNSIVSYSSYVDNNGNVKIDDSLLSEFVKMECPIYENTEFGKEIVGYKECRSLSNSVTEIWGGIKSLVSRIIGVEERVDTLETENQILKDELCKKDATYSWCLGVGL